MARIYLSSSSAADLAEHRKRITQSLRRQGHEVVCMEEYGSAAPVSPAQRCPKDVRDCDVYLGLLAWRYGKPARVEAGGDGHRSVTHLEYDEAVAHKKPRLLYLSVEREAWGGRFGGDWAASGLPPPVDEPGDAVEGLRATWRADPDCTHARDFCDVEPLVTRILEDVGRWFPSSLGPGRPAAPLQPGPLLPYLCDRRTQASDFGGLVAQASALGAPSVVVLRGDDAQAVPQFVRLLERHHWPRHLARASGATQPRPQAFADVQRIDVGWPDVGRADEFAPALTSAFVAAVSSVADRLPPKAASLPWARTTLAALRRPILVDLPIPCDRLDEALLPCLRVAADLFLCTSDEVATHPLLACIRGEWPRAPRTFLARRRTRARARTLERAVHTLSIEREGDPRLLVLQELSDVRVADAEAWTRLPDVAGWLRAHDPDRAVKAIFPEGAPRPMDPVAQKLRGLLTGAAAAGLGRAGPPTEGRRSMELTA